MRRKLVIACCLALFVLVGGVLFYAGFASPEPEPLEIPILLYHHILPDEVNRVYRENPFTVRTEDFEAQMQYLYDNGFHTLTLSELEAFLYAGRRLPRNSVMIHFDDGYYSNFVYAYPILQRFGHRAVVFMITHMVEDLGDDQPQMDHDSLTWTAAHSLVGVEDVFELASHTHNMHALVPNTGETKLVHATQEEIVADVRRSFDFLTNHSALAYPRGQFNDRVIEALQEAGITMAFTTVEEMVTQDSDPLQLGRFKVWRNMTLERFGEIIRGIGI